MKAVKILVRAAVLAAVVAAFFGVPYMKYAVKAQGLLWGALATLLFGRFFCDVCCPLGILQSAVNWCFHPRRHVRRVCTRLPETRRQRLVRWSVFVAAVALAACGCMGAVTTVLPISIFGKALTLWVPGLAVFAAVMVLAAIGDGRIWCNWICPFGTVFSLLARVAWRKSRVGAGCANCRRCFAAAADAKKAAAESGGIGRREVLRGVAALAVAEKLSDGGLAPVSVPGVPARKHAVLPPGAGSDRAFRLKCAACQLCIANCPGKCLKPATDLRSFGQPQMDFRNGYCIASCGRCGAVCPEGALTPLKSAERPHVHMGVAEWRRDLCLRPTGEECTACVRKCPVRAIHLVAGFPVIDRDACIGCGACEHVCPVRPEPAIHVEGYAEQRIVRPMGEDDLVAEIRRALQDGVSCVVARKGVVVAQFSGRGVQPIVAAIRSDPSVFCGATVGDRVVGRAAAAVYIVGRARKVVAELLAEDARAMLEAAGVEYAAVKTVPHILNRELTGGCPIDAKVADLAEPEKIVERLLAEIR